MRELPFVTPLWDYCPEGCCATEPIPPPTAEGLQ